MFRIVATLRCPERVANVRKRSASGDHLADDPALAPRSGAGENKSVIGLENLNVGGMLKNHSLAGAISDAGFGEFRRQAEYKGQWYGCRVVLADRFFPSSKNHADCGHLYAGLQLSEREWTCPGCGALV